MNELERDVRSLLRRKPPPPGFADRVLARSRGERVEPAWVSWWRWAAVGVAVALLVAAGGRYRDYRRGLEAKEQLMMALEITSEKLAFAESKIAGNDRLEKHR